MDVDSDDGLSNIEYWDYEFRTTAKVEPKPEPRPCTKEFALSHWDKSEFRWLHVTNANACSATELKARALPPRWTEWEKIGQKESFSEHIYVYEFRTTAKDESTLDLGPFPDVTIDVNEEVSQALAIHLLKSRRVAIVDLETGQRFMVTPGPLVKGGT